MSFAATQDSRHIPQPAGRDPDVLPLVQQTLAGNREAFDEIVFLFRDQVYATTWHMTRNTEDALDVAQEVFIRAYRALGSYKGRARFSTWLHRIVLNACIDHIRREKRHRNNISLTETLDE